MITVKNKIRLTDQKLFESPIPFCTGAYVNVHRPIYEKVKDSAADPRIEKVTLEIVFP